MTAIKLDLFTYLYMFCETPSYQPISKYINRCWS